jgi:hypothetical protein
MDSEKVEAKYASVDALLAFIVQAGSLLLAVDIDILDRGLRSDEAQESLQKFIVEGDSQVLEISVVGNDGKWNGCKP